MATKNTTTRKPNLVDQEVFATIVRDFGRRIDQFEAEHASVLKEHAKLEDDFLRLCSLPKDANGMRNIPDDLPV